MNVATLNLLYFKLSSDLDLPIKLAVKYNCNQVVVAGRKKQAVLSFQVILLFELKTGILALAECMDFCI